MQQPLQYGNFFTCNENLYNDCCSEQHYVTSTLRALVQPTLHNDFAYRPVSRSQGASRHWLHRPKKSLDFVSWNLPMVLEGWGRHTAWRHVLTHLWKKSELKLSLQFQYEENLGLKWLWDYTNTQDRYNRYHILNLWHTSQQRLINRPTVNQSFPLRVFFLFFALTKWLHFYGLQSNLWFTVLSKATGCHRETEYSLKDGVIDTRTVPETSVEIKSRIMACISVHTWALGA